MIVNWSINIGLLHIPRLVKHAGVRKNRFVTLAVLSVAAISLSIVVVNGSMAAEAAPQERPQQRRIEKPKALPKPKVDYAKFSHQTHVVPRILSGSSLH